MTADLDLSPEAVERLAKRHALHVSSKYPIAATLRALSAENARLRGVLKTLAEPRDRTFIGDPWAFYDEMTAYARAALAEGGEDA